MVVAIHELRRIVKTNVGVFNVNGAMTNIQIIQELNYSIYMNCVKPETDAGGQSTSVNA